MKNMKYLITSTMILGMILMGTLAVILRSKGIL